MTEQQLTVTTLQPENIFGVPVEAVAEAATRVGGLAVAYSENARKALGTTDPGNTVRLVAAGFPFIEAVRQEQPLDEQDLEIYLNTLKESGTGLRSGVESMPSVLSVLDEVLRAISEDDVTPQTFRAKVLEALTAPKTRAAAEATLHHLDSLKPFDSPSAQLEEDLRDLLDQSIGTNSGGSVAARNVFGNITDVLSDLAQAEPDSATKMPVLRLFARPLAALALGQLTDRKSKEMVKAAAPTAIEELTKALHHDGQGPTVRRSLVGTAASLPFARSKTNEKLAPIVTNLGPLVHALLQIAPADQASLAETRRQFQAFFLPEETA